jgi:opacity protein-like surface antigen
MKRVSGVAIIALGFASAAVLDIECADAADWHWDPQLIVAGNYDTNYGLDTGAGGQNVSVAGTIVNASLDASIADPTTKFEITPRLRSVYYPGHSQDQANDQFVDSHFEHEWQTVNFALNEYYWRQDMLRSYLPSTIIGTPLGQGTGGGDIGAINERIRQDFLLLNPTATFELGPRERLDVQAQYLNVSYSNQIPNQRQDFKDYTGGLGFEFAITPRSTLTFRGTASQLIPGSGSNANTYGAEGEWDYHLSERMQSYARLGVDHTTFDQNIYGQSSATSFAGGLGISRKFVRDDLFVDLMRSLSPSSFGEIVVRDELRLRLEHKFGPRSSGYVGLRGIKEQALGTGIGFSGQRYGQGALGFEWRIFRQFSIISEYAYTSLKTDNIPGTAGSNSVTISLDYQPHRPAEELGVRIGK